jgi:hypothetical protein
MPPSDTTNRLLTKVSSVSTRDGRLFVDGIDVLKLESKDDTFASCKPDSHYLTIKLRRRNGTLYGVLVDLYLVGADDEAAIWCAINDDTGNNSRMEREWREP